MFKAHYIFITILILNIFLVVTPVVASPSSNPADNSLCWLKDTCEKGQGEDKGEFCNNDKKCPDEVEQCPGEWGFCYPAPAAQKTNLQVPIGGYTTISNASQYIRTVYQVSLGIAVTAAIVVLMVAGFRWMTAAGNTSIIGQARTMILSAIIGLVLLFGASLLFQTINPDIVKLTLPRFPKLRPQSLAQTTWCDQLFKDDTEIKKFAPAGKDKNLTSTEKLQASDFKDRTRPGFYQEECSLAFYPFDNPSTACYGRGCLEGKICLKQEDQTLKCLESIFGGNIISPSGREATDVYLGLVCSGERVYFSDRSRTPGDLQTNQDGTQSYSFTQDIIDNLKDKTSFCANRNIKGIALVIVVNENIGADDTYAIGKNCQPLSQKFPTLIDYTQVSSGQLFQFADLVSSTTGNPGGRCDFNTSQFVPQ